MSYESAFQNMCDEQSTLLEKSYDNDFSNFTYLNSWSNNYLSWKNTKEFKILFIKYEDLELNKESVFEKIILFVNNISGINDKINEKKFINALKSTSFVNLRNKELNEGFEESIYSNEIGKKKLFFNLGFKNRWQKLLSKDTF